MRETHGKRWLRELVDFALDRDVDLEINRQREILEQMPDSAKSHFDLAVLLYSHGNVVEAISEFEAAIACDPLRACSYRKLGEIHVNLGDYERALQCATRAAALGDRALLEMFERYPNAANFVESAAKNV